MSVACYWLELTGTVQVGLRRYQDHEAPCTRPGRWRYHSALAVLGTAPVVWSDARPDAARWFKGPDGRYGSADFTWPPHDDPRWPQACECGVPFDPGDPWQDWLESLYRRAGTSEVMTLRDAPDGAMWDAYWYGRGGPDGRSLMVRTPGGHDWFIDGRASNCGLPDDTEHRCWVRHGEPPRITVGKDGLTCPAGGGSIQAGDYHGFLRDGVFT